MPFWSARRGVARVIIGPCVGRAGRFYMQGKVGKKGEKKTSYAVSQLPGRRRKQAF